MQQTNQYQLNLIETSDTFSPAPLNENAQKLEAAMAAETAARQNADSAEAQTRAAADADLDQRVAALEIKKFVYGTLIGNGGNLTVTLGFTPVVVLVKGQNTAMESTFMIAMTDEPTYYDSLSRTQMLKIVPDGFHLTHGNSAINTNKAPYFYIAFG